MIRISLYYCNENTKPVLMNEWSFRGFSIQLADGDIAEQDTEAVTTAAHWRLNGGNGTDGTIHTKGGLSIIEECRKIGGCPIGEAVVTGAGNLSAKYVIHAVGPYWNTEQDERMTKLLLRSAYHSTMQRADEIEVKSVSIPVISTGAFGVPVEWAIPIAVGSVFDFLSNRKTPLEIVRHVVYSGEHSNIESKFRDEIEKQLRERSERAAEAGI